MGLLSKILRIDPKSREGIIATTSGLGILVNTLIAVLKVVVGTLTASIAIVSEGMNNASDVLTSVLTLLGTKMAGKRPDDKHPFGHGRIEYLTALVISVLILVTGIEMLTSSVKRIFEPRELSISYLSLLLIAISAAMKFALGTYTIKMGKKAGSGTLEALGIDNRNDCIASVITIISSAIFLIFDLSVDAYAGILISALIIKSGLEVLRDTVSDLLGRPGEKELAQTLYREIKATPGILNAADMVLHNYGPETWSGSVNVEVDHEKTVGEIYQFLHELQVKIQNEHRVNMVFGIYAVGHDHPEVQELHDVVGDFVRDRKHIVGFHALYLDRDSGKIYCDLIVDYGLKDLDALKAEFTGYMAEHYPDNQLMLTIETEFV